MVSVLRFAMLWIASFTIAVPCALAFQTSGRHSAFPMPWSQRAVHVGSRDGHTPLQQTSSPDMPEMEIQAGGKEGDEMSIIDLEEPRGDDLEPEAKTLSESNTENNLDTTIMEDSDDTEVEMEEQETETPPVIQEEREEVSPSFMPVSSSLVPIDDSVRELLSAFVDITLSSSMALFRSFRTVAATVITASLPVQEREELLARMTPYGKKLLSAANEDSDEYMDRGSVQEEIAAAVLEEVQKKEEDWQQEKEKITEEIAKAAKARVESEVAIQQQRMEEDRRKMEDLMAKSKVKLESEIEALESQLEDAKKSIAKREKDAKTLVEQKEKETQELLKKKELEVKSLFDKQGEEKPLKENETQAKEAANLLQEEKRQLEEVEVMLAKRKQQQLQLESVEEDLRNRALEIQRAKEELEAKSTEQVPHLSPKEYRSLSQEEKGKLKARREAAKSELNQEEGREMKDESIHPILGPVVCDLGYKRIHLVPSGRLGTIAIWKKQRTYRNSRAKSMAAEKEKTMQLGFPGIISLYEDNNGRLSILDGQHRIGMMQALREKRNNDQGDNDLASVGESIFENVLVEVYPQPAEAENADKHAESLFLEINKAEPVKLFDMPGVASAKDRRVITEAVDTLQGQYPKMFSPSQRCRTPNVNIDNMRNSIYGANLLKKHDLKTAKQLVDWLVTQNAALGEQYENDATKRSYISEKAWKKASTFGFYLGLESSWLYV